MHLKSSLANETKAEPQGETSGNFCTSHLERENGNISEQLLARRRRVNKISGEIVIAAEETSMCQLQKRLQLRQRENSQRGGLIKPEQHLPVTSKPLVESGNMTASETSLQVGKTSSESG
ncbi:hypothetical protein EYF80_025136 [Liparis tanakae]|uniref:Uncharacterized protein n=1 Tax=Liparis tanakae TaxID=230148 RepID=A0A4Z2HFH7_9TELE|nr:hypothetical protein EYF80_025136 [Liparis tanakae]